MLTIQSCSKVLLPKSKWLYCTAFSYLSVQQRQKNSVFEFLIAFCPFLSYMLIVDWKSKIADTGDRGTNMTALIELGQ